MIRLESTPLTLTALSQLESNTDSHRTWDQADLLVPRISIANPMQSHRLKCRLASRLQLGFWAFDFHNMNINMGAVAYYILLYRKIDQSYKTK